MVITKSLDLNEQNLLQAVRFFLNIPYLWGGKNAMGMDCSGFTQIVMSLFGKKLPRNASEQASCGHEITTLSKSKAGDLVFFDHEDGKISHVGIVIDPERVIHCSGRVKVEKLDETGIFNAEAGSYSHHLVTTRRI
jgi:cell wall-associated NlpC family hydrolase